jgi:hypothetical protein
MTPPSTSEVNTASSLDVDDEKDFEQLFHRLQVLENWKELAIRPSSLEVCDPGDVDLLEKELDNLNDAIKSGFAWTHLFHRLKWLKKGIVA